MWNSLKASCVFDFILVMIWRWVNKIAPALDSGCILGHGRETIHQGSLFLSPQMRGPDLASNSKKTLWTPNFNVDLTGRKERLQSTFGKPGVWTPPQKENLYGEEISNFEEKTAEKEAPGFWMGARMEIISVGWESREKGGIKHLGNTQFRSHALTHRTLLLIFPGLRKPLTKTCGDIIILSALEYGLFPFHSPPPIWKTPKPSSLLFIPPS